MTATEPPEGRVGLVVEALGGQPPGGRHTLAALAQQLEQAAKHGDLAAYSAYWLSHAVLTGSYPIADDVERSVRQARLDGALAALGRIQPPTRRARRGPIRHNAPEVEIVQHRVVVDVSHTANSDTLTGIQRVVRETVGRWVRDGRPVDLVVFDRSLRTYRRASTDQALRAQGRPAPPANPRARPDGNVVVPWNSTVVVPELAGEYDRALRLLAVGRHSGNRLSLIGCDCIPVTTPETVNSAAVPAYYKYLSWVKEADTIAAISKAAAVEFTGFTRMLGALDRSGPSVVEVTLPSEAPPTSQSDRAEAAHALGATSLPLVLVVGSHEPRKNHLAVLHAAELLWRRGHVFTLAFVGGHAWKSEAFDRRVAELRASGRPVGIHRSLDDRLLWAAYRIAHHTVFPSLNEGFGLPVAESLATGTPVITSNFGSMAEIASDGGALLVDPRDDTAIALAMASLLEDDALHHMLAEQALARPRRTWDQYADEVWQTLAPTAKSADSG